MIGKSFQNWKTLLQPLDDITNYLSKSKYVSISNVLPDYGANAAKSKSIYSVATILDPRFKLAYVKGRKIFNQ
jgi:hypothetical protein